MKVSDATLMAFHDDELDPETARRVRLARQADLSLNARLEGLEQLGEFVRVWAAVANVRAASIAPPRAPARVRTGRAVGLALAVFGVALFIPGAPPPGEPTARTTFAVPSALGTPATRPLEPAVAVESVDFGALQGSIFLVESAHRETTTVVWLPEEPAPSATGTL